jgi:lipopolysaccharide/colanic/teichoic acid biosynthesis glycosyltransferase
MVLMPSMTLDMLLSGLTGWAQVNYAYGANIDDSLIKQYDLYYIKHSFYLDLNIALNNHTVLFYRGVNSFFFYSWMADVCRSNRFYI